MTTVAILPLDDRPVNYDYPKYLTRSAGMEVLLPEREWLGNPWRASQHAKLVSWLQEIVLHADALILAVDTLAYGGLIPSRTSLEPASAVLERLSFLKELKKSRPGLPIFASSVILRVNRDNSSEEEKPYWAVYGEKMFRLSYLEHKSELGHASPEETSEKDSLRVQIPDEVYTDYLWGRSRNHAVNIAMLDYVAEGIFDYLVLPQDDTMDYGWNIAEARKIQFIIRQRGLTQKAITYPGADEIGSLLFASYVARHAGITPRVYLRYSSVQSPRVVTVYEDRPFEEMVKAHLAPLGGWLAGSPAEADLLLYVNAPAVKQGDGYPQWLVWEGVEKVAERIPEKYRSGLYDWAGSGGFRATRAEMQSPYRNPEEFVRSFLAAIETHPVVALADVAFVNGMDLILGKELFTHPQVAKVGGIGGWNTAGNTLGTVLAQAVIRLASLKNGVTPAQQSAHLEFTFLRILDDYYYQAIERTHCLVEDYPALELPGYGGHLSDPAHLALIEQRVNERLGTAAQELRGLFIRSGLVKDVQVKGIYLPWQRMFEVGFEVNVVVS